MFDNYLELLGKIDRFAAELRAKYPNSFACTEGCTSCCVAGIRVWRVEYDHLCEHLTLSSAAGMSPERRVNSPRFSSRLMPRRRGAGERAASERASRSEGDMPAAGDKCDLLGTDDRCTIYDARPVVCRLWGMPIVGDDVKEMRCCEKNFASGIRLAELPISNAINRETVLFTLAAINHVYCDRIGLDPTERLLLKS